jgi:hypothetical protein
MFVEEFTAAGNAAKAKYGLLSRNPVGYFLAAMPKNTATVPRLVM